MVITLIWPKKDCSYRWTSLSLRLQDITDQFRGIYGKYFKSIKKKPKDHKMSPVGLGNITSNMVLCVIWHFMSHW